MPNANETKQTNAGLESEIDVLKNDMSKVKSDIESLVESMIGRTKAESGAMADATRVKVKEGVTSVETYIEDRPFTTVLVALGVGLFVGKFFSK